MHTLSSTMPALVGLALVEKAAAKRTGQYKLRAFWHREYQRRYGVCHQLLVSRGLRGASPEEQRAAFVGFKMRVRVRATHRPI